MAVYSIMSNVHTLTTVKEGEENKVKKALTQATNLVKFFIKETDELKQESYTNKSYADEYKSYCVDLETKLENCMSENTKLKGKLNDITTATTATTSEKFFDENFFKAYARTLSDEDRKKIEADVKSKVKRKY
jgi:hypothetical protein